jgi:hypothetical protein
MLTFVLVSLSISSVDLLELNDTNFEEYLSQASLSFVLASREDIPFCQEIIPRLRNVAEIIGPVIQFIILNEASSPIVRKKYGIFASPSLFVFRGIIRTAEYTDERNVPHMLRYLKRIVGPPIDFLETARDVHDYIEIHRISIILAAEEIDIDLNSTFTRVASELHDKFPFAIARTPDAIQQLGVEEVPSLQLHRNDDRQVIDFSLAFTVTEDILRKWISDNVVPKYHARDSVIFRDLSFDPRYTLVSFVDTSKKASFDLMHDTLQKVVSEVGDVLTYVYCDIYDMGTQILAMGFSGARDPVYAILSLGVQGVLETHLFPERRKPTSANIVKWVQKVLNESKHLKIASEDPIPNQSGPLFKVVGLEFRKVVSAQDTDVITAMLSGTEDNRSATLALMEEVADEFQKQHVTSVRFYYIDRDLNDVPVRDEWDGSVILLWPSGAEKVPLLLNSMMDVYDLMTAILTHGKTKPAFKIPVKYDPGLIEL